MSLTRQSLDKSGKKYSSASYFSFVMKHNWQHFALYAIIVILAMILPTFMLIDDLFDGEYTSMYLTARVEDITRTVSYIGIFISCGIAVLAGMSALSYVNSAKNVGCYHSFPIKREGMFLTETLTRVIYYLAAIIPGSIVSFIMIAAFFPLALGFVGEYCLSIIAGMLVFMMIYSVFLFSAGLTGSAVMRLLMTLVIFFLPLVLYYFAVTVIFSSNHMVNISYYLNEDVIAFLCPIYKAALIINELAYDGILPLVILAVPMTLIFTAGALVLHKFRKSELSGTSIIWKPVFAVVKYLVIFAAGMLGILIFGSGVFGNEGKLAVIIGAIMGLVLSFIVVNCIFYRSSKAMFKNIKGFAVFAVCFFVLTFVFVFDAFSIVGRPYSAAATEKIELVVNGRHIIMTDKEDIELAAGYVKDCHDNYRVDEIPEESYRLPYVYSENNENLIRSDYGFVSKAVYELENPNGYYYYDAYSNRGNGTLVQVPKFGIPLCVDISFSAADTFWQKILASDEYHEASDLASWMDPEYIGDVEIEIGGNTIYIYNNTAETATVYPRTTVEYYDKEYGHQSIGVNVEDGTYIKGILPMLTHSAEKAKNSTIVGIIRLYYSKADETHEYPTGYTNIIHPIYADDIELINYVMSVGIEACRQNGTDFGSARCDYTSAADYLAYASGFYEHPFLVNVSTGEAKLLSTEEFTELLSFTSSVTSTSVRRYSIRDLVFKEKGDYALLTKTPNTDQAYWMLFRENAMDTSELEAIFSALD